MYKKLWCVFSDPWCSGECQLMAITAYLHCSPEWCELPPMCKFSHPHMPLNAGSSFSDTGQITPYLWAQSHDSSAWCEGSFQCVSDQILSPLIISVLPKSRWSSPTKVSWMSNLLFLFIQFLPLLHLWETSTLFSSVFLPGTNQAQSCFASKITWDLVHSGKYGHRCFRSISEVSYPVKVF